MSTTLERTTTATLDRSGAADDMRLVDLWLSGRPAHTARAYARDAARFLAFTGRALAATTAADVIDFAAQLTGADSSKARTISAVKSLLTFGHTTGYLPFNVGAVVQLPKVKETVGERILAESDVHALIGATTTERDRLMLALLYRAGVRCSELIGLRWRDVAEVEGAELVLTIFGKGGKTRHVRVGGRIAKDLAALRDADADAPVFRSRKGSALDPSQVWRIVSSAAQRAGLGKVSPHWLRHAHASHALDRGAPAHLVQQTLGHASLTTTTRYAHARPTESSARYLPD